MRNTDLLESIKRAEICNANIEKCKGKCNRIPLTDYWMKKYETSKSQNIIVIQLMQRQIHHITKARCNLSHDQTRRYGTSWCPFVFEEYFNRYYDQWG